MINDNSVAFELFFKDNLSSGLQQATTKGVANLKQLENAKGGLSKSAGGLTGSLGGLTSGLGAMLAPAALAAAGIAALGAGLMSVISTGMDFTKVMSNVKALTGANADEFKRLNDAAISLGASTSFSSKQVADAMANAAAGGMSVNEIIEAMPGFLDLAAASNTDLARSVEIGMAQMNAFQLEAKDMNHIVDMMAFTTVKSATGMEDLADGLNYISASAASLKIPLSEVLAMQGTLGDAGLKGSMATRALSTAMQKLSAPTKQMSTVMDRLNLNFYNSEGQFIGINNMIGLLEDRMRGFTDEQRANALSILFGNEAFAEMNILMTKGAEGLKTLTTEIENSNGTAGQIAKTQLDNLSGDVEQFGGAWESLQLKIFSDGESGFRGLVQMGTNFLTKLSENWDVLTKPIGEVWGLMKDIYNVFADLFGMVGGDEIDLLSLVFQGIGETIRMALVPVKGFLSFIKLILSGIKSLIDGTFSFKDTLTAFADTVKGILLPIGEILQGVFTLNWDKIKSGASALKANFSNMTSDFADRIMNNGKKVQEQNAEAAIENKANLQAALPKVNTGLLKPVNSEATKVKSNIDVVGGSGSGKSVVVTINNLINSMNITGANITQNIKEEVTKAIVEAVADFETSYN